jgi:uncharacterized membrane protein YbhN (UPF0104 family)
MSDHQAATPVAPPAGGPGDHVGGPRRGRPNRWASLARVLSSPPVRWGFVAVAVGLAAYALTREWSGVRDALARLGYLRVAAAMLSVLFATLATMQVWRTLIAAFGSPLSARASGRILFIGQLGKYLPGSIWPVLAQMELASAHNVPRRRSASASVLTLLLALLTGLLIALATLPFVARSTPYRWVFLAAPVLLICLHPRLLNRLIDLLLRLARRPALEQPLAWRALAAALGWSAMSWLCYGLQIWLLVTRLGASYGSGALLAIGGFAFAWCVGFVVVFAPAGAGIREVLLIAMLGPVVGVGGATAVALLSRALVSLGDVLMAGVAVAYNVHLGVGRAQDSVAPAEDRPPDQGASQ